MIAARRAKSSDLSAASLARVRTLVEDAFAGHFDDTDWEHALGGLHVLLGEDDDLIGHVSVVPRVLEHDGRRIPTGYVEALAVRADRRRQGHASVLMSEAEAEIGRCYDLGALSDGTGIEAFYERRGWLRWSGATWAATLGGRVRTADEDGDVLVLPTGSSPGLDPAGSLACDWRAGDLW